jgi:hypothetical protein
VAVSKWRIRKADTSGGYEVVDKSIQSTTYFTNPWIVIPSRARNPYSRYECNGQGLTYANPIAAVLQVLPTLVSNIGRRFHHYFLGLLLEQPCR